MTDTIGSPWLACLVLVIVTVAARVRCGSWFAPAAFVGLVWSFFTCVSLLVVDYPVPSSGLWMLVVLIVAIQFGALIAHEFQAPVQGSTRPRGESLDSLILPCRRYSLFCTAIAMAGCIYFLFTSLDEFGLPFTPLGVLGVGARWTALRYDDAFEPWSVRLLVAWFHPAGLLGGILFACSRRRLDRAIGLTTLLPAVGYGILTGARAAILLGLTCWIGGYASALCIRHYGRLAIFNPKRVILLLITGACMVGMFAAIDAIRDSFSVQAFVLDVSDQKLGNYIFGPPAAFAAWYSHADISGAEWGAYTFANEFDLLHLKTRIIGRYTETSNLIGTEKTNVYTLFRDLIEDFTEAGAVLIGVCIGGLAGWLYCVRSKNVLGALFCLSAFYAAFLFSPIGSLFSFNGAALAWLVAWFVLARAKPLPSLTPPLNGRKAGAL